MAAAKAGREPPGLTPILRALWLDGSGDWDAAHELADDIGGTDGAARSTPTCTARKATSATPATGTARPAARPSKAPWMKSGPPSPAISSTAASPPDRLRFACRSLD